MLRLQVSEFVRLPEGALALAQQHDTGPILILSLLNNAGIPNEVLTQARDHVERIYRDIRIQIVWRTDDANDGTRMVDRPGLVSSDRNALQLTIVLVPEDLADRLDPGSTCAGFALSNDGRGARRT